VTRAGARRSRRVAVSTGRPVRLSTQNSVGASSGNASLSKRRRRLVGFIAPADILRARLHARDEGGGHFEPLG